MGVKPNTNKKITKYLGVSKQVCTTYKEVTGYETELVYNPIEIDKPKKVLNLISATRLTKEKGKNRIIKLADILDKNNIPYLWTIFTDDTNVINNTNIVYMKPRLDIINYIANADYLVQLSDNEGYCYSVIESLIVGTPVIVTECPVFKELGVKNGINGYILDFGLTNVPIKEIYKGLTDIEYKPKKDNWEDLLIKEKSNYEEEKNMKAKVRALKGFEGIRDAERNVYPKAGDEWITEQERAEFLESKNVIKIIELIQEKKPTKNTENTEKKITTHRRKRSVAQK